MDTAVLFADPVSTAAIYVIMINWIGFLVFAWDKYCSQNGMWRVKEQTLLSLAAVGGSVGLILGKKILNHKTRKEPFKTYLSSIFVIQVILMVAMGIPGIREFVRSIFQ